MRVISRNVTLIVRQGRRGPRSFYGLSEVVLMSPAAVPKAIAMGGHQALQDAGELTAFWS